MLRACTLLSRSPSALRARVSQLPPAFRENPLLFALSSNVEGAALSDLVSTLTTDHGHARLGALSGALSPGTISCSVAMLDKAVSSSFRSSLPGRDPDSVGRWHPIREETKEGAYERQGSSAAADVSHLLYFSDQSPQGLDALLRERYPKAAQLGLLAAPTPFVTGRPVTLFHGDRIHSGGAVGFELHHASPPSLSTDLSGLTAITDPVSVTQSEGNLVHELAGANPSKMLLAAIQRMPSKPDKDDEFFLGVLRAGRLEALYHIMSGDPSRGTMALEADSAPAAGETVQVFYQPRHFNASLIVDADFDAAGAPRVSLVSAPPGESAVASRLASLAEDDVVELDNHFIAASESGWVLGENSTATWKCTAAGARAHLKFP